MKARSYLSLFSLLAVLLSLGSTPAHAGASGVSFTDEEIAANLANAALISETAASCLTRTWDIHKRFFEQRKYSKFYGSRHPKYKTTEGRKQALLEMLPSLAKRVRRGEPEAISELNSRERELETTSCVGLAIKCLGEGFQKAGMAPTWQKIYAWIGRTGSDGSPLFYGTDVQKALVDLGWKSLYWNADISQNATWDNLDQAFAGPKEGTDWNPVWGGHALRWASVLRKKNYYEVPIHDIQTLVNFGIAPPADFKQVPFFVGTAHAGYHVFPGFKGQVIEAHSMRQLNSKDNIEVGMFNPLYQPVNGVSNGNGAPKWTRSEHYRSGVIVVPPGYLAEKPYVTPGPAINVPRNGTHPPERDDDEEEEDDRRRRRRERDRDWDNDEDWWRRWW
jgi:hypothetical protein